MFADARRAAEAEHAAAPGGAARRCSLDGAAPRRRRPVPGLRVMPEGGGGGQEGAAAEAEAEEEEEDSGGSSGDEDLHSTYAALARRLHRGSGAPGRRARLAGRLALLAGLAVRVTHAVLTSRN